MGHGDPKEVAELLNLFQVHLVIPGLEESLSAEFVGFAEANVDRVFFEIHSQVEWLSSLFCLIHSQAGHSLLWELGHDVIYSGYFFG